MRIWMKPDVMAQYKLIPSDVTQVLAEQNIESATGSFGENSDETYQYTMKYKGRLITPEEFGEIVKGRVVEDTDARVGAASP
jgi:multidrug efflux pump subunit AcrB